MSSGKIEKYKRNLAWKTLDKTLATQQGETLSVSFLAIQYMNCYDLHRSVLMDWLKDYENVGRCKIEGDNLIILKVGE